jgi:hypothetical protein
VKLEEAMNFAQRPALTQAVAVLTCAFFLVMTANPGYGQNNPPPQNYPPQQNYPQQQNYPPGQNYPQQQNYPQGQNYPPQQNYPQDQNYPQAQAQNYPPPPSFSPSQLDNLVSRIALYPDPLLAQIFAAATFPDQIPDAARFAMDNRNLRGGDLANAMSQANLPFDPSVQALIPFPSVLDMMARDMNWTSQLGNAVLADRPDVMDAVQRMRGEAVNYGYLRSNPQIRVVSMPGEIQIVPVDPGYIYVPVYDPYIVYAPPRPGFYVGNAIGFGAGFGIGSAFGGWGWGGGFNWRSHGVIVNNVYWGRTWQNRGFYEHNYGNWNGGHWNRAVDVNRNINIDRNVNINRNMNINRDINVNRSFDNRNFDNSRNVVRGNQNYAVTPNRGYERHAEPEHSGAFHGTEAGHAERNAGNWGRESRGGGGENRGGENRGGGDRGGRK